jgi:uncharacterized iron-regulated protein
VSLALGMLERDVQEPLDHFQMGHMDEAEFLSQARPWPGYERTYKSILDLAMSAKWPIVAPSLPGAVALEIAASGADATKARGADGAPMAREWKCPTSDAYFARFQALTGSRPSPWVTPAPDARAVERYYLAQCLKDETMAESIATAHAVASAGGKSPLVVSITDRFHSDYGQGVVERTRRRMPGRILVTIAIVPVPSLEQAVPTADDRSRADYVVLVGRSTP